MRREAFWVSILALLLVVLPSAARQNHQSAPAQPSSDFERDLDLYPEVFLAASQSMSNATADANPHLYTTVLRTDAPDDANRAQEILDILRKSMAKYRNYRAALADGYEPFMPKTDQQRYWFISSRNAYASAFEFNPGHPTSLLYKKSKGNYEFEGAVFTAPKSATEAQLNDRVPLSVASWREHVNLCIAPKRAPGQTADSKRFGLNGSITAKDACTTAGGRWVPQVFGWMVAVFPFESDSSAIWPH